MTGNPSIGFKRAEINPGTEEENTDGKLLLVLVGLALQWGLRFKKGMCHPKNTHLKHDLLLNRFKRDFLLNRGFGLRESLLNELYGF